VTPSGIENRPNVFGLDRAALETVVETLGEPRYRARQLYKWLYKKRARSFAAMTDLTKAVRERLGSGHDLRWPQVVDRQLSYDGTRKYLFRLDDGVTVETVSIPEETRRTICISTQAGCPLACAFCLTGIAGYKRNLKVWEILGQVATVMAEAAPGGPPARARGTTGGGRPWNVVVMGMGEPLLNYEATVGALRILMDPEGFAVSPKKLTLSTVGILPALEKLAQEPVRPNLAISLHAPDAELRRTLMPIEEKYHLEDVVAAAGRYPIPRGGRVTYEYVLLRGVNDGPAHARALVRLLGGSRVKVNLIPLNPAAEIPFDSPSPEAVDGFARVLAEARITVSVRRPRGQDILAACGQLHLRRAPGSARGLAAL
jgi:23S rRNA (adenine2503-C2)-methyltransferase